MKFFSKGHNLILLKEKFGIKNIPKLHIFSIENYIKNQKKVLKFINTNFSKKVAIRSSFEIEDKKKGSNAGKFLSFLNINPKDNEDLSSSISKVISSCNSKINKKKNYFFVQDMVEDVDISGVCMTYSLINYVKSYNINYHKGSDTSNVTSGMGNNQNFVFIENENYKLKNKKFQNIIKNVKQLEKIYKTDKLDIEFVYTKKNKFILLQVRPLLIDKIFSKKNFLQSCSQLEKKIKKIQIQVDGLYGKTTYFGVMPDWNPAEMIGIKPNPLALSLYKNLITDNIWAKSRSDYGYNDARPNQLMTTFFGTPFIDLRVDINSWLPKNIPSKLKTQLSNYYLKKFSLNKDMHDKIEFDIIFSSFYFNLKEKLDENLKNIINKKNKEILLKELKTITLNSFKKIDVELEKIKSLKKKQDRISKKNIYEIDKIYWLIQDCKKYGTLPFAGLARSAFMATSFLNSLIELKVITLDDKEKFLSSISTITTQIITDKRKLNKKKFLEKYGHLRPSMYDINNKNYRENYTRYFAGKNNLIKTSKNFVFEKKKLLEISKLLKKNKIEIPVRNFLDILKKSIASREYAKYIFSRSIDLAFENIKKIFNRIKFNPKNASFISIETLLNLYNKLDNKNLKKILYNEFINNKKIYISNNLIKLPPVITSPMDLYSNIEKNRINFITQKVTEGNLIKLNNKKKMNLNKKIVLIENADPGYDYIFNQKINGLITKYGGMNSHMSIRCSELSIPAAIGIGENLYQKISSLKYILLNCSSKKIN